MKKYFKVSISILVVLIMAIMAGCGSANETSKLENESSESEEASTSSSDLYASINDMRADVMGTYTKKPTQTSNGTYYSTLKITSTTVTETASSSENTHTLSYDYQIKEWVPETGVITMVDNDYCPIITVKGDGTLFYGTSTYTKEGSSGSSSSTTSTSSSEDGSSVLQVTETKVKSNSSYTICTGTLKNTGEKTYKFVKVKGSFKDSSGTVVDTDSTYAVGEEGLEPGESTTFEMSVPKNNDIKSCDVTVYDFQN